MQVVFGGIIAYVLLLIYASSVFMTIAIVMRESPQKASELFNDGMSLSMSTIGALVSSLVISVLAVTDPGKAPVTGRMTEADLTKGQMTATQVATMTYLAVWLLCGLSAFVVGEMIYPKGLQALRDHGRAWIGLAVSAGYAYFGLKMK